MFAIFVKTWGSRISNMCLAGYFSIFSHLRSQIWAMFYIIKWFSQRSICTKNFENYLTILQDALVTKTQKRWNSRSANQPTFCTFLSRCYIHPGWRFCFGSEFVERCLWDFEMQGSLISENLLTRLPCPSGKLRRKEKSRRIGFSHNLCEISFKHTLCTFGVISTDIVQFCRARERFGVRSCLIVVLLTGGRWRWCSTPARGPAPAARGQ